MLDPGPFAALCLQTDCQPRAAREKGLTFGSLLMEADKPKEMEPNTMFNKVILIGRLGQNTEARTAQNNNEYVVLNIATQESWKNDKGDHETRTEWHRAFAWSNLSRPSRRGSSSPSKAPFRCMECLAIFLFVGASIIVAHINVYLT